MPGAPHHRLANFVLAAMLVCASAPAQSPPAPSAPTQTPPTPVPTPGPTLGVAVIRPVGGSKVRGNLRLIQKGSALRITGRINNLTPGYHAFHAHLYGDTRSISGDSAGGEFSVPVSNNESPGQAPDAVEFNGDLGRIDAAENGVAVIDVTHENVSLSDLLGRGLVVHGPPGSSEPVRVGIGVVGIGNPNWRWPLGDQ